MPGLNPMTWSEERTARWEALAEELRRRLGPGSPVPSAERATLEPRLGADLSGAVVHRGALPGSLARVTGGEAISIGSHVLGAAADLDARTPRGVALLAHELTHAVRPARRAGDLAGAPIQRTPAVVETAHAGQDDEEVVARRIEATILHGALGGADGPSSASSAGVVDAEALTDRVYCRLVDELLVERERAAWLA